MKFALMFVLCALIPLGPLGSSCKSTDPKAPASAQAADTSDTSGEGGEKSQPKGPAYLLRMVDYRSGARFELVNPSHTTAVNQYSTVRSDPSRKVTDEAWMIGLVDYIREQGWSKDEKRGSAPTMAKDSLRWSLEMTGPGGTSFVAEPMDAKGGQRTRLRTIQKAFLDTYNATNGFQAVRTESGKLPFKVPDYQKTPPTKGGK